jgi:hypothetical protein
MSIGTPYDDANPLHRRPTKRHQIGIYAIDWATGDTLKGSIPAHTESLRAAIIQALARLCVIGTQTSTTPGSGETRTESCSAA